MTDVGSAEEGRLTLVKAIGAPPVQDVIGYQGAKLASFLDGAHGSVKFRERRVSRGTEIGLLIRVESDKRYIRAFYYRRRCRRAIGLSKFGVNGSVFSLNTINGVEHRRLNDRLPCGCL